MIDILTRALPYEERTDTRDKKTTVKTASVQPLAVSACSFVKFLIDLCTRQCLSTPPTSAFDVEQNVEAFAARRKKRHF